MKKKKNLSEERERERGKFQANPLLSSLQPPFGLSRTVLSFFEKKKNLSEERERERERGKFVPDLVIVFVLFYKDVIGIYVCVFRERERELCSCDR